MAVDQLLREDGLIGSQEARVDVVSPRRAFSPLNFPLQGDDFQ